MSPVFLNHSLIFSLFYIAFALHLITAVPVVKNDNPLDKFIEFLLKNNCSMPKEVQIPFQQTDSSPFNYLSIPLKECQTPEALNGKKEANLLCKEVFEVLQNITCYENKSPLPKINSSYLSENVCKDFAAMQDVLPKRNECLSGKLGDKIICELLCTGEYELLCKTLLWSYDTQAKIKNALENKMKENGKESMNILASSKDTTQVEISTVQEETVVDNQAMNNEVSENKMPNIHIEEKKNSLDGSNMNILKLVSSSTVTSILNKTSTSTINLPSTNNQDGGFSKVTNTSENIKSIVPSKIVTQPVTQKLNQIDAQNEDIQPAEPNLNLPDKNADNSENTINVQSENIKIGSPQIDLSPDTNINILTSEDEASQNEESNTSLNVLTNKENANGDINITSEKAENTIIPNSKMDNDLSNVNLQEQENETKFKGKQTDSDKKIEKPKEEELDISNGAGVTSFTDSKLFELTTLQTPDKNEDPEQHQEDKDPEQYNDTENDGDYPKPEYDGAFNLPSKNKESDVKSSIVAGANQISSNYDTDISSRNNLGRLSDDIQMIPSFPEQEDSHFFFYFLSIVLILMAGYLIFHNKQKIIALIVEGRHERRRRSHGAGYKKLETK